MALFVPRVGKKQIDAIEAVFMQLKAKTLESQASTQAVVDALQVVGATQARDEMHSSS